MPKEFIITFAALIFILVTSGLIISSSKFKNYKRNRTNKRAGYKTIIENEDIEDEARRYKAYQERESLRKARLEAKRKENQHRSATKIAEAVRRGRQSRKKTMDQPSSTRKIDLVQEPAKLIREEYTKIDADIAGALLEVGSNPAESLSKLKGVLEAINKLQRDYGEFSAFKDQGIRDISKTMKNIEDAIPLISKMVAIENPENTHAALKKKKKELEQLKKEVKEKFNGGRWKKFRSDMMKVLTDKMKTFVDNLYESIIKGSVSHFTEGNQEESLRALADAKEVLKLYNIGKSSPAYALEKRNSVEKAIEIIEKYGEVNSIASERSLSPNKITKVRQLWEKVDDMVYIAGSEHDSLFTGTEWGNIDQIFSQKLNDENDKIKEHEELE